MRTREQEEYRQGGDADQEPGYTEIQPELTLAALLSVLIIQEWNGCSWVTGTTIFACHAPVEPVC